MKVVASATEKLMAAIRACRCMRQMRGHSMTSKAPSLFERVASSAPVTFLRRNCQQVKPERKRVSLLDTLAHVSW